MKRFLFLNSARQLLAFSIQPSGTNLPDFSLEPWLRVDDHGYLQVIYDWGPARSRPWRMVCAPVTSLPPKRNVAEEPKVA
jgi:hypothetical protein